MITPFFSSFGRIAYLKEGCQKIKIEIDKKFF
jgi:hypothetical protein